MDSVITKADPVPVRLKIVLSINDTTHDVILLTDILSLYEVYRTLLSFPFIKIKSFNIDFDDNVY